MGKTYSNIISKDIVLPIYNNNTINSLLELTASRMLTKKGREIVWTSTALF